MVSNSPDFYEFADFKFDPDRLVLFYKGEFVHSAEKRDLEVLSVLLSAPDKVATFEEIIETVWSDNPHGATPIRVNQYVSRLRKVFRRLDPGTIYIENIKGRGYRFLLDVVAVGSERSLEEIVEPLVSPSNPEAKPFHSPYILWQERSKRHALVFASIFVFLASAALFWTLYSRDDIEEVKRVVRESQMYESLVLYKHPEDFNEGVLDQYWTPDLDINKNYDRTRIRQSIEKLVNEGRRYGEETKCLQFDFQSVNVNVRGDQATVRTLEKWLLAHYNNDGEILRNSTVGPYFVDYVVRNINGRWLIEKSTTARTIRPTPSLTDLQIVTQPVAGQEFLLNLIGEDFEPVTILIEVVGGGCPEIKPCRIENRVLLERATLSSNVLEGVPLTLASGEFRITARNDDSKPSNPVLLTVP